MAPWHVCDAEGALTANGFQQTAARLLALSRAWLEVLPVESVRQRAEELLASQIIHAADGLQLAAALVWCQGRPQGGHLFALTGG